MIFIPKYKALLKGPNTQANSKQNQAKLSKFHENHLAIEHGGIVPGPENVEKRLEAALLRIVLNPNDLGVVGRARTDILVGRIVKQALRVPNLRLPDAGDALERQLDAPEAAGAELGELLARRRDVLVGALGDRRRLRREFRGAGAEPELVEEVHGGLLGEGAVGVGEGGDGLAAEVGERRRRRRRREEGFRERVKCGGGCGGGGGGGEEEEKWRGGGGGGYGFEHFCLGWAGLG
ncbi:hypothetical protein TIFTF001_010289 [Ficus carica]|uniref:Uncharacterized protein n=1 Tax=Ficus carica TaxID=3494 RepID=A0AA88A8G0_FICCA|nr:hypothetical protein TIFTF001_010289 [Ficus carica]